MSRNTQPQSRIMALLLAGALLLGVWASPVFAEGAANEPPGTEQEAQPPGGGEQENGENAEGVAPSDVEGFPLNIINLDEPEDTETDPEDFGPSWPEVEDEAEAGPEDEQPQQTPALGASGIMPAGANLNGTEVTVTDLVAGQLATEIGNLSIPPADITKLVVTGAMNQTDMDYIWRGNINGRIDGVLTGLVELDISEVILPFTTLAVYQFAHHRALQAVSLPANLQSIGERIFYRCTGLTSIDLPASLQTIGVRTFNGCTGLTSIDLSNLSNLQSIGDNTFNGCTQLTSINLPANLQSIGDSTFYECSELMNVNLPVNLQSIGEGTFQGCTKLTSVNLSNLSNLQSIGNHTFASTKLTSIDLSNLSNLQSIGKYTFASTKPTSINLPANLQSIGDYTFYNCTELTSIDLPANLQSIGDSTFWGCTQLTSIDLPANLQSIGDYTFSGCTQLTSIDLSNLSNLQSIGDSTFSGCTQLTSIDLPANLQSIGNHTFASTKLTSIDLPANLQSIGNHTFASTKLTSIDLPANLQSIGDYTFRGCNQLTSIDLSKIPVVAAVGNFSFQNTSSVTAIVPPRLLADYQTNANWKYNVDNHSVLLTADTTPYALTFTADPAGWGNITGATNGAAVEVAEEIKLTAVPSAHYAFSHWEATGAKTTDDTDNPAIFTITGNASITAVFTQSPYTFNFEASPIGGTVQASRTNGSAVVYGDTVTMTADPAPGYSFTRWEATGATTTDNTANPASFTITGNTSITAVFAKDNGGGTDPTPTTYTVTYNANGGTGTPPGPFTVEAGKTHTVASATSLTAPSGQRFREWSTSRSGGTAYAPGDGLTVNGHITLYAIWEAIPTYTLTLQAQTGGNITPGSGGQYEAGKVITITASADSGYTFGGWHTSNGGSFGNAGSLSTTFTMPAGDTTVTAQFKPKDTTSSGGGSSSGGNGGSSTPDSSTPTPITFSGLPDTVRVGVPFTLTPSGFDTQSGSTGWEWDAEYFDATFNSPATFTPLKEGRTEIRYRGADGRRGSVTVDILAAPTEDSTTSPGNGTSNPNTGGDSTGSGTTDTDSAYNPNTGGGASLPNTGSDSTQNPDTGGDSSVKVNPQTRDSTPPYALYLIGAVVALTGVAGLLIWRRRSVKQ